MYLSVIRIYNTYSKCIIQTYLKNVYTKLFNNTKQLSKFK